MRMERRHFLKIAGFAALALSSFVRAVAGTLPKQVVFALRLGRYPGPVKPWDEREISKPGKWAG